VRYNRTMPTPFMHMALARCLLNDPQLPHAAHDLLQAAWGAFLLGSIAPDARVSSGFDRVHTHFFEYGPVIDPPPVAAMLARHPDLRRPAVHDDTQAAFVTGYVAHLAMDAVWCTTLLYPRFLHDDSWATSRTRSVLYHMLLGFLDQRDRSRLQDADYRQLSAAAPDHWLRFISDEGLCRWRDAVASQIAPGASSLTLNILGQRIGMQASEMAAFVADQARMAPLWQAVPPTQLAAVEEAAYSATRRAVTGYLTDHSS
jgi:hypothetical protein